MIVALLLFMLPLFQMIWRRRRAQRYAASQAPGE
jgi:hypothetical protein